MLGDLERVTLLDEHDLIPPVDGIARIVLASLSVNTGFCSRAHGQGRPS
jgi:hypothetical protein